MLLHNQIDKKILRQKIESCLEKRFTLSFYKYHRIENPKELRDRLYLTWSKLNILGRIYIASEGINAQISLPVEKKEEFIEHLHGIPFLKGVYLNECFEEKKYSFIKLKIKVKPKIVNDGLNDNSFDATDKGQHLSARQFNELVERDDTVLVDMRNHYESEVGHFRGAILPNVDTFRDALNWVDRYLTENKNKTKNIVLYCTGGIRCEKASAYYKQLGYNKVFQLIGGIVRYVHEVEKDHLTNKFIGKNFVFDERLGERISSEIISHCHQCGSSSDTHVNCVNDACHLLFIQCEKCREKFERCCSNECLEVIKLPEEKQRKLRKGINKGMQVYRKGRFPNHLNTNLI